MKPKILTQPQVNLHVYIFLGVCMEGRGLQSWVVVTSGEDPRVDPGGKDGWGMTVMSPIFLCTPANGVKVIRVVEKRPALTLYLDRSVGNLGKRFLGMVGKI